MAAHCAHATVFLVDACTCSLEAENEELKVDLEHALSAAYQLREDMRPSIGEPGTEEAAFDGKSREAILTQLLNANRVGKAHATEIAALKEDLRKTKSELDSQLAASGASGDDVATLRAKLRDLSDDNAKLRTDLGDGSGGGGSSSGGGANYSSTATSPIKSYMNNAQPAPPSVHHRSTSPIKSSPLKRSITSSSMGSILSDQHDQQQRQPRPPSPTLSIISQAPTVREADQLSTVGGNGLDHTFTATSEAAVAMQAKVVKASEKARSKFFQQHKSEIDSALTLVQSVLRGHRARQELQEGMEALKRAAPITTARSAAAAATAAAEETRSSPNRRARGFPPPPARTLPNPNSSSSRRFEGNSSAPMGSSVGSATAPHLLRGRSKEASTVAPVPIATKQPPRYIPPPQPALKVPAAAAAAAAAAGLPVTSASAGTAYSDEDSNSERSATPTNGSRRGGGGGEKGTPAPLSRPTSASSFASSFVSEDLTSFASDSDVSSDSDDDF